MKSIIIFIALIALFVLAGCAQEAKDPIKVGFVGSLTGKWSTAGNSVYHGVLIAQEEINNNGGIHGRKIELIAEDTASDVKNAVTATQKLINVDKVVVIIGGVMSAEALATAPLIEEAGVVLLTTTAMTTPLEDAGEYVFKLREKIDVHADKTLALIQEQGYKDLAVISQHYEACEDYLRIMGDLYDDYGMSVTGTEYYDGGDTDMRTQLTKLKATDPDALFICGLYTDSGLVVKQAKQLGFNKPVYGIVTVDSKKFIEAAGDAANGVIFTSTKFSCEDAAYFCTVLQEKYDMKPDYRNSFGYDALQLVAEAMRREGYSSDNVHDGLLGIKDFIGASGKTSFDAKGNADKEVLVKQIIDGERVVVG